MLTQEEAGAVSALVTGAGSREGIGFAIARRLAGLGYGVSITSTTGRIAERVDDLAALGYGVRGFVVDLTYLPVALRLAEEVGPISVLVNNAGMGSTTQHAIIKPLIEYSEADWDTTIAVSLKTAFCATRAFMPGMVSAGYGRIVNVASVTGPYVATKNVAAYAVAKAGMVGFTRALAIEAGPCGVTVNAVAPGWIATAASSEEDLAAGRATPVCRPGTPEEVAHAVSFLASQEASYINGETMVVDGGNLVQEHKGREITK